jgi:holliday junction DNA helicase RuvA
MIGSIKGKIILKTEKFLLVETSGVGYKISVSSDTLSKIGDPASIQSSSLAKEIFLFIHTHVREDALDLYGFLDYAELEFFEMLINVSGIGPKGALGILGISTLETLRRAINTGDTSYLTKISGIGRKTAEKIVIELRDKVAKENNEQGSASLQDELDALEALKSLGYSQNEAREALKKVGADLDTNKKIKEALKILSGK